MRKETCPVGNVGAAAARAHFGPNTRLYAADYEFRQLKSWRDRVRPALALPGLIYLDLDEVRNRVVFGIDRKAAPNERAALAREVAARGVPGGAVIIEDADPVELIADLTDDIRPQPGGVHIDFYPDPGPSYCTLGFNVSFEAGEGFVTASHCTAVQGQEDGDYVGWGIEERDPAYWTGGPCPANRRCRYSDSALIHYAFVVEQGDGATIARTTTRGGSCPSSTTISTTSPRLYIRSKQDTPTTNLVVDKVGRTTGWTTGTVNATCMDVNSVGDITMLCQHRATLPVDFGDSGSPIFEWDEDDGATLYGLLWGRTGGSCASAYFSDVDSIEYELGPMNIGVCPSC